MSNLCKRRRYVLAKVQLWQSRLDEDHGAELAAIRRAAVVAVPLRVDA